MMQSLPLFHQIAGKPVLLVGNGDVADARRRLIEAAGGTIVSEPGPDVRLAFIADVSESKSLAAELRAQGLLVHVADQPELCDFFLPAIVDRTPVMVAIGTQGMSASLAKALKERLNLLLPPGLGRLARGIYATRPTVKKRYPTVTERRHFWADMLAPGGPLDPLAEHASAEDIIAGKLAEGDSPALEQTSEIIIPLQGADALTLAQLRLLGAADLILYAADTPLKILDFARRDAVMRIGHMPPADYPGRVVVLRWG